LGITIVITEDIVVRKGCESLIRNRDRSKMSRKSGLIESIGTLATPSIIGVMLIRREETERILCLVHFILPRGIQYRLILNSSPVGEDILYS
jgi:hypothetical protein